MKISLVISDVDATLLTPDHRITDAAVAAVTALRNAGIAFTVASSRPPRALGQIVERLGLSAPFAAFNGGVVQMPDGRTLRAHYLNREICRTVHQIAEFFDLELWVYCDHDWHVAKITPFVEREQATVGFAPVLEDDIEDIFGTAAKLVIVGDPAKIADAESVVRRDIGHSVSASKSKPRFIDITNLNANKGTVVSELAETLGVPAQEIAVIGDGQNDILMFERAGVSFAMGQAAENVRLSATHVTAANTDEGFARAMERIVSGL